MMGQGATHRDVAAYALGVLDERDAARFEDHLAECDACAVELESLLPVTAMLSQVDGDSFVSMEESVREGRMLDEMVNAVAYDRSRARVRRMFSLVAGIVALIVLGGVTALGAWTLGGAGDGTSPVASGSPSPKSGAEGPGVGGLEELPGERFSATDPDTKVHADVVLEPHEWGTQVSIAVGAVRGPLTCQLVAVGSDGLGEVVYTWKVPPQGYGTNANPELLFLQGVTAVDRSKIDRMELQSLDSAGRTGLLVAVDT
jgi:Putative zinc-finger